MSRRRRRRKAAGGGGFWSKAAIVVIAVLVLAFAGIYSAVRGYLHSDGFRKLLAAKVSDAADVEGEFSPFRWDGFAVDCASFEARGEGEIRAMRLDGMHTEVGLGGLKRGVWEIRGSRLHRVEVAVDARGGGGEERVEEMPVVRESGPRERRAEVKSGWLPREVELQGLEVGELVVRVDLDDGPVFADGVGLRAEQVKGGGRWSYEVDLSGGRVSLPFEFCDEVRLKRAALRVHDETVFLNSVDARVWEAGVVDAVGEWSSRSGVFAVEGDVSGVGCEEVLSEDWSKRLTGVMSTTFAAGDRSGDVVAVGELRIENGVLTALPVLDALAAYADTRRFRSLNLSEARTKWRWTDGETRFSEMVVASEGLIRLEGSLVVRGENLDGSFRLGLVPGTLASLPGAETDVFVRGERGLMWAPLRITGTLDDPEEDLTDRLIDAAGLRMFEMIPETGERAIKFTRRMIDDVPAKVVEEGSKIIGEGEKVLDDVESIIDGFFGGGG
ncbi:MAG: hypothetical protein ACQCXQ_15420 [Verrucomicrobiales bacterium]